MEQQVREMVEETVRIDIDTPLGDNKPVLAEIKAMNEVIREEREERAAILGRGVEGDRASNAGSMSRKEVPMIQTKIKELTKDGVSEMPTRGSRKFDSSNPHIIDEIVVSNPGSSDQKDKLFMWMFLLFGMVVMYFSMHPNRKA